MSRTIPVVIVAGFLGSGKTTLLNHLLHNNRGARIGVVVNDFGAINIDSMLVAGQVDSTISLGNGCMCCAIDVSEMDALFERLARPGSDIDVIVVEASGLAEPKNLVRLVVGSENAGIGYGGLVEVVDAKEFDATLQRHPELSGHLRLADLVVLNKADLVAEQELSRVRADVGAVVGGAPIVPATRGRVDPKLLFDIPEREPDAQLSFDELLRGDDEHAHLHAGYETVAFTAPRPLDPRALLDVLTEPPAGLFRAKGFVGFAVGGAARRFECHVVGGSIEFVPLRGPAGTTELVLIGAGLAADDARTRLAACVHDGEVLDPDALLPIWRFVPVDYRPTHSEIPSAKC